MFNVKEIGDAHVIEAVCSAPLSEVEDSAVSIRMSLATAPIIDEFGSILNPNKTQVWIVPYILHNQNFLFFYFFDLLNKLYHY